MHTCIAPPLPRLSGPWPSALGELAGLRQCVWAGNKGLEEAELPECMAKFADNQVSNGTINLA